MLNDFIRSIFVPVKLNELTKYCMVIINEDLPAGA